MGTFKSANIYAPLTNTIEFCYKYKHLTNRKTIMLNEIKILIVDDEPELCAGLVAYFTAAGYSATSVNKGMAMAEAISTDMPHLVLLDLGLPDVEGIELAKDLASRPEIGVIIITGRTSSIDRVVGLEIGADDYVSEYLCPLDQHH